MICSNKKSRNGAFHAHASRTSDRIALLCFPFFAFGEWCYDEIVTYTPTSKEIKRKRGREHDRGLGRQWRRGKEERGVRGESNLRVHMLLHVGESTPGGGSFSESAYTVCQTRPRKTSFTSRNATCGDNSIVHFIRSAALRYKHAYPLS